MSAKITAAATLVATLCLFVTSQSFADGVIGTAASYDARMGVGVEVSQNGIMRVMQVDPHGRAARSGLRRGDTILGVNGRGPTSLEDFSRTLPNHMMIRDERTGTIIHGIDDPRPRIAPMTRMIPAQTWPRQQRVLPPQRWGRPRQMMPPVPRMQPRGVYLPPVPYYSGP